MIIQISDDATEAVVENLRESLHKDGLSVMPVTTQKRRYLVTTGRGSPDVRNYGLLPGVADLHVVTDSYQLVSRKWKTSRSVVTLSQGTVIGENHFQFMAGPCSVESPEQVERTAAFLGEQGVSIMRGGVFKPRTSPYTYRGGGIEALRYLSEATVRRKIAIISEVLEPAQIDEMYPYIDIFQVGARNSQNFNLLAALGRQDKPVLIKRGMSGTLDELLNAAEYVFSSGNEQILLCERGIRTYEKAYRNTFDINAVVWLKERSHLPVIVDPSHATGARSMVIPISLAAIAAGADGLLVEIHPNPFEAISDGDQSLTLEDASRLFQQARALIAFKQSSL